MPKLKTKSSAKKRFRVRGNKGLGAKLNELRITYRKAERNHILTKKSHHRKRRLRTDGVIGKSDIRNVRRLLIGS